MNFQIMQYDVAAKEVADKVVSIMEEMMESMQNEGRTEMQDLRDNLVFLDYCRSEIGKAITEKKNNLLQERSIRHE